MPIGDDTYAYRSRLPHLVRPERMYYVTFCTVHREVLSCIARDIVLATCTSLHEQLWWLDAIVVMPDHVHLIAIPYDEKIGAVIGRAKGRSSYEVNRATGRSGALWQRDAFDRIVRSDENLAQKREYIFNNPVRKGLVANWQDYRWIWWSGRL